MFRFSCVLYQLAWLQRHANCVTLAMHLRSVDMHVHVRIVTCMACITQSFAQIHSK